MARHAGACSPTAVWRGAQGMLGGAVLRPGSLAGGRGAADSLSQAAPRPLCLRREGKMAALVVFWSPARGLMQRCWGQLERSLRRGLPGPPWAPALAVQAPATLPDPLEDIREESNKAPNFLDSIFWMAAPKKRRTIEVNRCRRRNPSKLIKLKTNIDVCPKCGNLKQKHVLCGYCYKKIKMETGLIRIQIKEKEAGPFNAPTVETVVLYEGEKPTERDEGKRIIERNRKRPSWFTQN
ncbi:39S ribosomal protein L32, mitochondrial [Dermochelys coriacea]|uniref:39S ribosomal protein L32, mitochondrial n=1 Tax=Dermochelys coriacea TaxID=27794 RepID=UPI0018E6F269|nr:39S ribosomal protein L32, mitochondrial [Dermochelys coriacea]